jgi:hypothetical protein
VVTPIPAPAEATSNDLAAVVDERVLANPVVRRVVATLQQERKANLVADQLEHRWETTHAHRRPPESGADLAVAFQEALPQHPELHMMRFASWWIEGVYPGFCRWVRVKKPPAFNRFAHELKRLMPKGRTDRGPRGHRDRTTRYLLRPPAAAERIEREQKKAPGLNETRGDTVMRAVSGARPSG